MTQQYSTQQVNVAPVYLDPDTGYVPTDQVPPPDTETLSQAQILARGLGA